MRQYNENIERIFEFEEGRKQKSPSGEGRDGQSLFIIFDKLAFFGVVM